MRFLFLTTLILTVIGRTFAASAHEACFTVQGMTCATCGLTLKSAVKKLKGIQEVRPSVEKGDAIIQFNGQEVNARAIQKAIDDVGYKATPKECKKI
ncbi:MAG: hypothetical protein COT74_00625 [Bdellovibrionales bacterium CG10_big_fil_rev_8_21_14_0_10_45_34]|nr:MAG: hypothetical protein COT74_00625 [Bdellovibrionales bacterium CG10_big_fil_rev_8_21_14_0_10_45_34]